MNVIRFQKAAAASYEQMMSVMSGQLATRVVAAARVALGQTVLDTASGTEIVAEVAVSAVGPSGRVTATDISPAMLEESRKRLGARDNVSFRVEDAKSLSFADQSFDAYFGPIERGAGLPGQEYLAQPERVRAAVREEMRQELGDDGGPVQVAVENTYASGRR